MPLHGNTVYCCEDCKKNQKAASQHKLYGILKEFRRGFLGNFKLFEKLLPNPGKQSYSREELISNGFKHNCYFGAFTDQDKRTWYRVADYNFTFFKKDENSFITIVKQ
jgi:hypothetical protein